MECEINEIEKFIFFSEQSDDYIFINKDPKSKFFLLPELLAYLKTIVGHKFEKLCFVILLKDGYQEVKLTKPTRDKGVDVYAFFSINLQSIFKRKFYEKTLFLLFGEAKTKKPTTKTKSIGYDVVLKIIGSLEHFKKKPEKYFLIDDDVELNIKPFVIANAEFSEDAMEYATDMGIALFNRFLVGICIINLEIACYLSNGKWMLNIDELNEIYIKDLNDLKTIYLKKDKG